MKSHRSDDRTDVRIIANIPRNVSDSDKLRFRKLTGSESLSQLYQFKVEFLCPCNDLDMKSLLGKSMSLEIPLIQGGSRFLHGNITRIEYAGHYLQEGRDKLYIFTLHPSLWYLTQNRDCHIWQGQSVPDIIAGLLAKYNINIENRLSSHYRQWEYCVQYQESDFDFISRLMEHEGIYYYFSHQKEGHTLILADSPNAHRPFNDAYAQIDYLAAQPGVVDHQEGITCWNTAQEITPRVYTLDDYDFRKPRAHLLEVCRNPASFAANKADVFEWPGRYIDNQHGQFYAQIRQQAFKAQQQQMYGNTTACGVAPGSTFTLKNSPFPADSDAFLVTHVEYELYDCTLHDELDQGNQDKGPFQATFRAVPADIVWRPQRITPWPKTCGPQTAEVTGPAGESIWTDKYGRVKLKFRWDRYSQPDDRSSCWVRVSSSWAGWKYGSLQIPRIGEEVVVDFINGDPDRPLVTGRVYNEECMPPWQLPDDATRMGFMSRSKKGGVDNASFLFLEDAPGRESFTMHAERDMNISVEHDKNITVDGALAQEIKGETHFKHYGMCNTLKMMPDIQTFLLGKTAVIGVGGRADFIAGGRYERIHGKSETQVSQSMSQHAGENISCHARGNILFDAGKQIIYGDSLYLNKESSDPNNQAEKKLMTLQALTPEEIADQKVSKQQQQQKIPTSVIYKKGVSVEINGVDNKRVDKDQKVEIKGAVTRSIDGSWQEHVKDDLKIQADADAHLNCGGKVCIETKDMEHKIEGHIETHAGNTLTVCGTTESINMLNYTNSSIAMKNEGVVMSNNMLNIGNTTLHMSTNTLSLSLGQININAVALSLSLSGLAIFI
ncbi:type VI secretion system Vgr family protein [Photorhabdus asymbiotica]|uniref:type VI secretion system Vgr family protein n=1 Tax=Photorhabdus asymbiotica TaxID=291112 RepID=UPI003DA6F279